MPLRAAALTVLCVLACAGAMAQATGTPPERQRELVRMVRQDCGSCHGMHLTGGLGPPLTTAALADKPVLSMAATIFHGRPGTPMPPWRAFVTEAEALWIAEQLANGFPPWPPRPQP